MCGCACVITSGVILIYRLPILLPRFIWFTDLDTCLARFLLTLFLLYNVQELVRLMLHYGRCSYSVGELLVAHADFPYIYVNSWPTQGNTTISSNQPEVMARLPDNTELCHSSLLESIYIIVSQFCFVYWSVCVWSSPGVAASPHSMTFTCNV